MNQQAKSRHLVGLVSQPHAGFGKPAFDGINRAATFDDEHGQKELAGMIRELANETPKR